MITRHIIKACCGNKSYIFETQKPIMKNHLDAFEKAGYLVPKQFINIGLFYVQNKGLIATTSFGSTRFQVRCSARNADDLLNAFEQLLDSTVNV